MVRGAGGNTVRFHKGQVVSFQVRRSRRGHVRSAWVKSSVPLIIHAPPVGESYHPPRTTFRRMNRIGAAISSEPTHDGEA